MRHDVLGLGREDIVGLTVVPGIQQHGDEPV